MCLLYLGKHALTKIAKGIVKICKEDVSYHTFNADKVHFSLLFR